MNIPINTPLPTQASVSTRDRLIEAMQEALRHKGYHGVGLTELLTKAQAPKGVMYHHFPGGKQALAVAAIEAVVDQLTQGLETLLARSVDPAQALGAWMAGAQKRLSSSGYSQGCPLATIALESSPQDTAVRDALARGFLAIRQRLSSALESAGIAPVRAVNLAALIVSAYEGSLVQARVAGNVDAMQNTAQALLDLVRLSLPSNSQPTAV